MNLHVDRGLATTLRPIETEGEWIGADGKTMCRCNKRKTRCPIHKGQRGTKLTENGKQIHYDDYCDHGRRRTLCPEESCGFHYDHSLSFFNLRR